MKTNLIALDWNNNVYNSTFVHVNIAYTPKVQIRFQLGAKIYEDNIYN